MSLELYILIEIGFTLTLLYLLIKLRYFLITLPIKAEHLKCSHWTLHKYKGFSGSSKCVWCNKTIDQVVNNE